VVQLTSFRIAVERTGFRQEFTVHVDSSPRQLDDIARTGHDWFQKRSSAIKTIPSIAVASRNGEACKRLSWAEFDQIQLGIYARPIQAERKRGRRINPDTQETEEFE
jgi:hypothetical protein